MALCDLLWTKSDDEMKMNIFEEELLDTSVTYGIIYFRFTWPKQNIKRKWTVVGHSVLEVFRVCLVFPPLVSVYGLFPVLVSCNLVNSVPGVCD